VNWSFLEAGHGKGPPDGVGAAIKRAADTSVLQGSDITNAQTLFKCLSEKYIDVELFLVEGNDIERIEALLKPMSIKTVSGTMKIHQVIYYTYALYSYMYRNISFQSNLDICLYSNTKKYVFNFFRKQKYTKPNITV
jgi:hypothetical protein